MNTEEANAREKLITILEYFIPDCRLKLVDDMIELSFLINTVNDPAAVRDTMNSFIKENTGGVDQEFYARFALTYLQIASTIKLSGESEREFLRKIRKEQYFTIESERVDDELIQSL